jgi:hypothetical protein
MHREAGMDQVGLVMPQDVKTRREQLGADPEIGDEWEAGSVRVQDVMVRFKSCLTREGWKVVREVYVRAAPPFGEKILGQFGFGEDMERRAKALAVNLRRSLMEKSQTHKTIRRTRC